MIAFKVNSVFLDLKPKTAVSITINSPLFAREATPGLVTYPIKIPVTPLNQRTLDFPEILASQRTAAIEYPAQFFIDGILWRQGVIRYIGYSAKEQTYAVTFKSDAGDFASLTRDQSIRSIQYPVQAFSAVAQQPYPDSSYALFPVKHATFYGDKRPDFHGYVNYWSNGSFAGAQALSPFLYVPWVLGQIMAGYGYNLAGAWLQELYVQRLVIWNNTQHVAGDSFKPADHLPDIRVGELLQALRNHFFLAYLFDANSKTLTVARLKDILANTDFVNWTAKAENDYSTQELDSAGFTLNQALESQEELNKRLSTDPAQLKINNGREEWPTASGFFHMVREIDSVTPARSWLVPATETKGTSGAYETGENKVGLRLLQYQGLQKDSLNQDYPLCSAIDENYQGAPLNGRSLRWAGPTGLYEQNGKEWLAFLAAAKPMERQVRLSIADLRALDPTRKIMIDRLKYFYESLSFSVSSEGIGIAKGQFLKVAV